MVSSNHLLFALPFALFIFQLDGKKSEREGKKKIVSEEKKMQEERKKTIEGKGTSYTMNP